MTTGPITLTVGWISRHTPPGAGADGRDAAVIDIAQDLLLRDLHERGGLDALVFKGGTSLDADTVVLQLVNDIDATTIGPFTDGMTERRGTWWLTIQNPFGTDESTPSSKLDLSPPPARSRKTPTAPGNRWWHGERSELRLALREAFGRPIRV